MAAGLPLTLIFLPMILREVGLVDYGIWATLSSVLAAAGLLDAGVRTETVRRVAAAVALQDLESAKRTAAQAATLLAVLGSALVVVVGLAALTLVPALFPRLDSSRVVAVAVVLTILMAVVAVQLASACWYALLNGTQHPEYENYAVPLSSLTFSVVTLLSCTQLPGLESLVLGACAALAVKLALQRVGMQRVLPHTRFRPASLRGTKSLVGTSTLLLVAQLGTLVDFQFDKIVLTRVIGPEAAAQYQVGTQLPLQAYAVAILPATVLLAGLAELRISAPDRARRLYELGSRLTLTAGGLVLGGVAVLGQSFVSQWLGGAFTQAGTASALLSIGLLINLLSAPWYFFCVAEQQPGIVAVSAAVNAVVNCTASVLLTVRIGFEGALYGSIAGSGASLIVFWVLMARTWPGRRWLRSAVLTGCVTTVVWLLMHATGLADRDDPLGFAAATVTFLVAYVVAVLAVRLVRPADIRDVVRSQERAAQP